MKTTDERERCDTWWDEVTANVYIYIYIYIWETQKKTKKLKKNKQTNKEQREFHE